MWSIRIVCIVCIFHFSDESKFNLFGSDGKHFVWHQIGGKTEAQVRKEVSKRWWRKCHGWGMFSAAGVGPLIQIHGRVNANVYQNLLKQHAVLFLQAPPNQPAIFMQDNAPYHTAKWVKQFLEARNIEIMKWPFQGSDLNQTWNGTSNVCFIIHYFSYSLYCCGTSWFFKTHPVCSNWSA